MYDIAIVGGGIMGCSAAIDLTEAGMKVVVVDKRTLGSGASGVNAGTHSMQNKRMPLIPYALRGREIWQGMSERLGTDLRYRQTGGLIVALDQAEADVLAARTAERRAAGVPAEMITGDRAREIEPHLSNHVVAASHSAIDGFSDTLRTGRAFQSGLRRRGIGFHEHTAVTGIERTGKGFAVMADGLRLDARRLLLAGGAWLKGLLAMVGCDLPVDYRMNQALVLERVPAQLRVVMGHMSGLLTLKQSLYGKIILGGGWPGRGDAATGRSELFPESVASSLRIARRVVPIVGESSLLRAWLGFEADMPDLMPIAGAVPGVPEAWVIGCVGGGYTIGPYLARLLCTQILGGNPELPLFDPGREQVRAP